MSRVSRHRPEAILIGILLLALVLRISTLGGQSLWADEGFTAQIVTGPLSGVISSVRQTESTPPLYYLLEWLWVALAGHSEFALRAPSALLGTATVGAVYAVAVRLGNRAAAIPASALAACSPFLIWYSQEARAYALLAFLFTVGLWFFLRALSEESIWAFAGWAACSALALATHYFAIFAVFGEGAWLIWRCQHRSLAFASAAVPAAVWIALLPLLLYQRDHVPRPWMAEFSLRDQILATGQEFVGGHTWTPLIHRILIPLLALALVALIGFGARARPSVLRNPVALLALFTIAAPIALSLLGPNYLAPRNVIGTWPAIAIVVGLAAAALGRIGFWTVGLVCATFLAIALSVATDSALQREDWRGLLAGIPLSVPIVVAEGRNDGPVVRYYRPHAVVCKGDIELPAVALVGVPGAVNRAALQASALYRPVSDRVVQHLVVEQLAATQPARNGCFPASESLTLLPAA